MLIKFLMFDKEMWGIKPHTLLLNVNWRQTFMLIVSKNFHLVVPNNLYLGPHIGLNKKITF